MVSEQKGVGDGQMSAYILSEPLSLGSGELKIRTSLLFSYTLLFLVSQSTLKCLFVVTNTGKMFIILKMTFVSVVSCFLVCLSRCIDYIRFRNDNYAVLNNTSWTTQPLGNMVF